jgi:hypothetical protein
MGSFCQYEDNEIFSSGNDVRAHGKYRETVVFWKMEQFNPWFNCKIAGMYGSPFFNEV